MNETVNSEMPAAQAVLQNAITADLPIVAILGQSIGQSPEGSDKICLAALARLGIEGSSWNDIFASGSMDSDFSAGSMSVSKDAIRRKSLPRLPTRIYR